MKNIIIAALAAVSLTATAVDAPFKPKENRKIKAMGGSIMVPNSMKGHILVANMQMKVPASELEKTVKQLIGMTRLDIRFVNVPGEVSPSVANKKVKELGANAVIFITDSDKCDVSLLCAPENGWTIINSSVVTKDAKNEIFAAARLRKELMRGFFAATGAMNSRYPGTIMNYIGKPSDLDKLVEEIPVDMSMRTIDYLAKMGVTPVQYTTYQRAVQNGWAPAPTNDIQKAIWDKVHAMPTTPIKIKPETKKVRE
jgi:hypothetical protein